MDAAGGWGAGCEMMLQPEAEAYVRELQPFPIAEVGSRPWQKQRRRVEQLNVQAHHNKSAGGGDFVTEAMITEEKVPVIIHELLVIEQWRRRIYPKIRGDLVQGNPASLYAILYYEGILVNLLELLFWTEDGVRACDDDLLEVLDYLWRNVVALNYHAQSGDYWPKPMSLDEMRAGIEDREQHQQMSERRQEFVTCLTSLSVLWYIIDKHQVLPMSAWNNILGKNDMPVGIALVIDNRPWLRRGTESMEKFRQKEWQKAQGQDMMVICEYEAHCWFMMHTFVTLKVCRDKYSFNTYRKEQLLRARKFLNEVLVDQMPPLVDVQRALDELSFLQPPHATEEKFRSSLVIEPVPRIMNSIEKGARWDQLAEDQRRRLTDPATVMEQSKEMAELFDQMVANMPQEEGAPELPELTEDQVRKYLAAAGLRDE
eukprot:TRINITY_DN8841_c0_g1_i1.p1 TRINITY_DN8841_c0_g1~~TRINITY_DN8841_c0_g1_i1.p1  ORF type:complete len:428 (+),score=177.82 TRINITY_DN8841_c0_g1_i1:76-1359(+)